MYILRSGKTNPTKTGKRKKTHPQKFSGKSSVSPRMRPNHPFFKAIFGKGVGCGWVSFPRGGLLDCVKQDRLLVVNLDVCVLEADVVITIRYGKATILFAGIGFSEIMLCIRLYQFVLKGKPVVSDPFEKYASVWITSPSRRRKQKKKQPPPRKWWLLTFY